MKKDAPSFEVHRFENLQLEFHFYYERYPWWQFWLFFQRRLCLIVAIVPPDIRNVTASEKEQIASDVFQRFVKPNTTKHQLAYVKLYFAPIDDSFRFFTFSD
jgi:hypothetical protein